MQQEFWRYFWQSASTVNQKARLCSEPCDMYSTLNHATTPKPVFSLWLDFALLALGSMFCSSKIDVAGSTPAHRTLRTPWHGQLKNKISGLSKGTGTVIVSDPLVNDFLPLEYQPGSSNLYALHEAEETQGFSCAQVVPVKLRNLKKK